MDILKRWVSLQVDLGSFDSRAAVYNFALKMTFRAVLLAFIFNIALLPLGYALGLVPLSVADASLAILDLDRFKAVNDCHGHCAGDEVIKAVAEVLREVFGDEHLIARLGGEEFGVIVRGGGVAQRIALVERARNMVEARAIYCDGVAIGTTVSAGVAEFGPDRRPESVYSAADSALYRAKAGGRNRVVHEAEQAELGPLDTQHGHEAMPIGMMQFSGEQMPATS